MYKDANSIGSDVTDVDAIKNSLKNILVTRRGSVPGTPRFGSDLYKIVFSPMDHLTESIAKKYIRQSITEFEPRIILNNIIFRRVEEFNKLIIDLEFSYADAEFNDNNDSVAVSFQL